MDQFAKKSHKVQVVHLVQEKCHQLSRADVNKLPDVTTPNIVIDADQSPERCHSLFPQFRVQGSHTGDKGELDHNSLKTEFIFSFEDAGGFRRVSMTAIIALRAFSSTKEE